MERKSVSNWLMAACLLSCAITIAQPVLHDRGLAIPGGSISNMLTSSAATDMFHPAVGKHTLSTRDAKWIIQAGDTGNGIAARLGIEFAQLAAMNPTMQWRNLQIGQVLRIPCDDDDMPPPTNGGTQPYTVVAGDTGNDIAAAKRISFAALDAANPGVKWYLLQIGQVLNVPAAASGSASMTSSTMSMTSTTTATSTTSVSSTLSSSTTSTTPSSSAESSDSDTDSPITSTTMSSSDSSPESTTSTSTASDVSTESSISSSSTTSVESTSLTMSSASMLSSTTMSTVSDTSTTTSGTDPGPSSVTSSSSSTSASSSSDTTTTTLVTSSVTQDPGTSTTSSASSTITSTLTSIASNSETSSSSPDNPTTITTESASTTDSGPSSTTGSSSPDDSTTTEQTTSTTNSEPSTTTSSTSTLTTTSDGSNDPNDNSFLNPGPSKRAAVLPIVNVRLARNAKIGSTYTVKSGDTGVAIAAANGISFSSLSDANSGVVWTNLQIGQVLLLPSETKQAQKPGSVQSIPRKAGKDVYITYSGPAATPPYPAINSWLSFDTLWTSNMANIGTNCDFASGKVAANTKAETLLLKKAILSVSRDTSVKASFILAMVLQESAGCVRAPTTKSWEGIKNPGLMQSFKGRYTCNTGSRVMQPCSDLMIKNMILDGVKGNVNVGIIPALKTAASNFGVSWPMSASGTAKVDEALLYYQAARIYNSGSIPMDGDLSGTTGSTRCYVSDVVNRLMGWVNAKKECSL